MKEDEFDEEKEEKVKKMQPILYGLREKSM